MGNQSSSSRGAPVSVSSFLTDDEEATNSSTRIASLHGNLMRSHSHRDPMNYYRVIQVLGEGSMGSVSKVRKRDTHVGGSSRASFVAREKGCCFQLFSFCPMMEANKTKILEVTDSDSSRRQLKSKNSKVLEHKPSSLISYGGKKDVVYALKSLHLDRCTNTELKEELKNEVEILRSLDHPHIVKAIEVFDYRDQLGLILEVCTGGDLYSRDPYSEQQASDIIRGLMSAVAYLHSRKIVHRDIKFENIMFVNSSAESEVKLIDFGLSQKYADNSHLHDAVGTVYTMAPELLGQDYDAKVDVWSLGVLTFMLLSSSMPFYGKDRVQVIKRILKGRYSFSSKRWKYVSPEAKEFVTTLLQIDPNDRPSSDQALKEPWLGESAVDYSAGANSEALDNVHAAMQAFAGYGKLKKLSLMVVAYKSTSEEIGFLRKLFNKFDKLQDGEVSLPEFKAAFMEHYDYSEGELEKLFAGIDIDGTGSVHYSEFLASTIEAHGSIDEERLAEAFDRIDCDDTGFITVQNLKEFLGEDIPDRYLAEVIDEADLRNDHRIAYDEFLALWNDDGDEMLKNAKVQAKARRSNHGTGSTASSISSVDGLTEDTDSTRVSVTGSVFYDQARSDWV